MLVVHEVIACSTSAMILIGAKSMLKLLKNENIQLSSETTHDVEWNRWPLRGSGVIDKNNHFHPTA